jgi:DNA-binding NarL/FixJ family response regulator
MPHIILIADDDPGIRLAVKDYLELESYSVITASNGQEALDLLETCHPHLLISDIKMPRKDGYALIEQLRQRLEFRLLPVIFLTHRGTVQEKIRGYQAGCDAYLPKPFDMGELLAVIQNLLARSHTIQTELLYTYPGIVKTFPSEMSVNHHNLELETLKMKTREQEVLNLIALGLSNVEIGKKLHLSPRTIEKYVSNLLKKTQTNNRAELVRFALEHHLVD